MDDLAGEVAAERACEENVGAGDLDGHAGTTEGGVFHTNLFHSLWWVSLGGWLQRRPAAEARQSAQGQRDLVHLGKMTATHMMPGATALTLMPFFACCCAKLRVKVAIAPFVDE